MASIRLDSTSLRAHPVISPGNGPTQAAKPLIATKLSSKAVRFQGKDATKTNRQSGNKVLINLFGDPGKNMLWTLGYSVGGVLLLPMPTVATGAFCMAGVHLVSASYQFLTKKPDTSARKSDSPRFSGHPPKRAEKSLSLLA